MFLQKGSSNAGGWTGRAKIRVRVRGDAEISVIFSGSFDAKRNGTCERMADEKDARRKRVTD